jgi:putative peptidoglycan lipid II flippase
MFPQRIKALLRGQGLLGVHLSLITSIQIVISFAIQIFTVACFGAGRTTDALYAGLTLPLVLTVLLIETFTVVVIPLLSSESEAELQALGWQLFLGSSAFFAVVAGLLYVFAPLYVPFLVPGFDPAAQQLTIRMTHIQCWSLIGSGSYAVLSSLYQVRGRFIWAVLSQLLGFVIGGVLLVWKLKTAGISFAAWTQLIIAIIPTLLLLPILGRMQLSWRREFFKKIWANMRPMLLGKAYLLLNTPFDRILASHLAPGTIVIFELVGRFYAAILRILNKGLVMPSLPPLSRLAQEGNWRKFSALYRRKALQMGVIGGITIAMILLVVGIARFFAVELGLDHMAGKINAETVGVLWMITVLMALVLPSVCISNVQGNAFFAQRDTATPTRIGVIFCTLGFGTKIAGFFLAGLKGVVLAGTLGAVAQAIVMEVSLRRRIAQHTRTAASRISSAAFMPRPPVMHDALTDVEGA